MIQTGDWVAWRAGGRENGARRLGRVIWTKADGLLQGRALGDLVQKTCGRRDYRGVISTGKGIPDRCVIVMIQRKGKRGPVQPQLYAPYKHWLKSSPLKGYELQLGEDDV